VVNEREDTFFYEKKQESIARSFPGLDISFEEG